MQHLATTLEQEFAAFTETQLVALCLLADRKRVGKHEVERQTFTADGMVYQCRLRGIEPIGRGGAKLELLEKALLVTEPGRHQLLIHRMDALREAIQAIYLARKAERREQRRRRKDHQYKVGAGRIADRTIFGVGGLSNNKPQKHHFLPIFYLKRWVESASDRKLVEYSRPYGPLIKRRRTDPAGTGYLERLYAIEGLPPELAQQVEEGFMRPVDTLAADALSLLESGDATMRRSARHRSSWSLFLMSLMMRMPNDLKALKSSYAQRWQESSPEIAKGFSDRTGIELARAEAIVRSTLTKQMDRMAMGVFRQLVDHQNIGNTLKRERPCQRERA